MVFCRSPAGNLVRVLRVLIGMLRQLTAVHEHLEFSATMLVLVGSCNVWQSTLCGKRSKINTPTLGSLARSKGVDRFVRAGIVSPAEGQLMCQRIECLAFIRRNVEAHIFLQLDADEIGNDLSRVYLPLLNQLIHYL